MIERIDSKQPNSKAKLLKPMATGAVLGMTSRYVIPTKQEFGALRQTADTFFTNAATTARSANRSMLKYGAIGAVIAASITLLAKAIKNQKKPQTYTDTFEYSKYQALIDAPDYACEFLLYGD